MNIPIHERQAQLVACAKAVAGLAANRELTAVHVSKVETDHEIRRVLEAIVRRWSRYVAASYASAAGVASAQGQADRDHVVPCRVLVDRMIMSPEKCEEILHTAVVLARITKQEHRRLGGIYADHEPLYVEMLQAPISSLAELGLRRYQAKNIDVDLIASPLVATGKAQVMLVD